MSKNNRTSIRASRVARSGFTLVEMLLALVLTGVVLSAAGRVTVSVLQAEQIASHHMRTDLRRSVALDALVRDWDARLLGPNAVDVILDASLRPTIRMFTLIDTGGPGETTRQIPARVTYHIEIQHNVDAIRLVRDAEILVGHRSLQSETLACDLESVEVVVHRDGVWQRIEASSSRDVSPIAAIRVRLTWPDDELQTRTFLLKDMLK